MSEIGGRMCMEGEWVGCERSEIECKVSGWGVCGEG